MDYKIDDVIEFKNGEYLILDVIKNKENKTYVFDTNILSNYKNNNKN